MVTRRYQLVPGGVNWIDDTLRREKLEPVPATYRPSVAVKRRARFYMTAVRYRGGLAWFKASLKSEPRLLRGLRDEISTQQALAAYERRARTSFDSPSWLTGSSRRDRAWLLRRYWIGSYAGDMQNGFGWSPGFVRVVRPERMATVVQEIGRMSTFMRGRLRLPTHHHGWYRLDYQYYRRKILPGLLKHSLNPGWTKRGLLNWEALLDRHRNFLKRHATSFTHGDLYPNNLMLARRGQRHTIVLFDWELVNWTLPTLDAVLVWLLAWQHPLWQTKFRRAFFKQIGGGQPMIRAWNLAQLSLAVRLLAYAFVRLTNGQPQHYPRLPRPSRSRAERMARAMITAVNQASAALWSR